MWSCPHLRKILREYKAGGQGKFSWACRVLAVQLSRWEVRRVWSRVVEIQMGRGDDCQRYLESQTIRPCWLTWSFRVPLFLAPVSHLSTGFVVCLLPLTLEHESLLSENFQKGADRGFSFWETSVSYYKGIFRGSKAYLPLTPFLSSLLYSWPQLHKMNRTRVEVSQPSQSFLAALTPHQVKKRPGWLTFFFNWSIVDLQCCVSFRCTAKWISYTYSKSPTYEPSSYELSKMQTCVHMSYQVS